MSDFFAKFAYGAHADDEPHFWPEEPPPDYDDGPPEVEEFPPDVPPTEVDGKPRGNSRRDSGNSKPSSSDGEVDDPLARLRNFGWLDQQEFPPLRWVVPGLIPEGLTILAGRPKAGKSWLALQVALAAAAGGRALGAVDVGPARRVLLLALEDGDRRLQQRARHLMEGGPLPPRLDYLTDVPPPTAVDVIRRWLASTDDDVPPLVVLDTLGRVLPPAGFGQGTYERDYQAAAALKRVVDERPGTAMIVVHHTRKIGGEDFVDHVSGTAGLTGAADAITVLSRPRGEDRGLLRITGRDVEERELAVVCGQGRWRLLGGDLDEAEKAAQQLVAEQRLGDRSTEILRIAADQPQGVRPADIATVLGIDTDTAGRYLRRMAERGDLHRTGRGTYASVRSVRMSETSGTDTAKEGVRSVRLSDSGADTRRSDTSDSPDRQYGSDTSDTVIGDTQPQPVDRCTRCGGKLDPVLAGMGERVHPTCADPESFDEAAERRALSALADVIDIDDPFAEGGLDDVPPHQVGPCVRCGSPTRRYGPGANPLCRSCRGGDHR
ncbi:MAG: AAA family ATPase [Acidothermus sp.]|nr:AAA family ATPase [Acidothermus sp.]